MEPTDKGETWLAEPQSQHHLAEYKGLNFGAERHYRKNSHMGWIIMYGCQ